MYPLVRSSVGIPGKPVAAEVPGSIETVLMWENIINLYLMMYFRCVPQQG